MEDPLINPELKSPSLFPAMRELIKNSLPVVVSEVFQFLIRVINLLLVGRTDKYVMDGIGLGNIWFALTASAVSYGLAGGLDTLLSHSYGQKKYQEVGIWLQRGLIAITIYVGLAIVLCTYSEPIFIALQIDPVVAGYASRFVIWTLPGLWFFMAQDSYRRYIQVQGYFWPYTLANGISAALHGVWGVLLTHTLDLKEVGVGLATSFTYFLSFVIMFYIVKRKENPLCKVPWTFTHIVHDMLRYYRFALPTIFGFLLGFGCFEGNQYLATFLGIDAMAALFAMIGVEGIAFMIPLGLSITVSSLVGSSVGEGCNKKARTYWHAAVLLSVLVEVPIMVLFIITFDWWAAGFTTVRLTQDEGVLEFMEGALIVVSIMTIVTGANEVMSGVLRGLGKQTEMTIIYIIGFYIICLPCSYLFSQVLTWGLNGIFLGLIVGTIVAFIPNWVLAQVSQWKTINCTSKAAAIKG